MTEDLKNYERSITKKHSFGWTPQYEEEFSTELNAVVFFPIIHEVIEKLDWEIIFQDKSFIEVKRPAQGFHWGQKITITYESGKVTVNSKSLGNEMWDFGRNSKRVKLFIYAFQELEKQYDHQALVELEEEVEKINNWEDYEIPEALPLPVEQSPPKIWIPIVGGIFMSVILGFLIAFLTRNIGYVIGLYEVGVGFLIALGFKYLIRASNYTDFNKLTYIIIGVILSTYVLNQYFIYELIISENDIPSFGFLDFIKFRFQEGLIIESINTGWIGLVISWIVQGGLTYSITQYTNAYNLTQYQLEKVPTEVVDFAFYHFVKKKSETEVRNELSKMGWTKTEDQDDVFVSISALQEIHQFNRIE